MIRSVIVGRSVGLTNSTLAVAIREAALFEPIERKKVYELVAERLVQEITDRRLTPGDELPRERELAEVYRVGRSSVREALRMLESKGLIASPGSGRLVVAEYANPLNHSLALLLEMHDGDLQELFEVRRILEVERPVRVRRVELQHVPLAEGEVQVQLARQRRRALVDAVVLARDPLGVGRRDLGRRGAHVTRPGVASTVSCSPLSTSPRRRSRASQTSTWRV